MADLDRLSVLMGLVETDDDVSNAFGCDFVPSLGQVAVEVPEVPDGNQLISTKSCLYTASSDIWTTLGTNLKMGVESVVALTICFV